MTDLSNNLSKFVSQFYLDVGGDVGAARLAVQEVQETSPLLASFLAGLAVLSDLDLSDEDYEFFDKYERMLVNPSKQNETYRGSYRIQLHDEND